LDQPQVEPQVEPQPEQESSIVEETVDVTPAPVSEPTPVTQPSKRKRPLKKKPEDDDIPIPKRKKKKQDDDELMDLVRFCSTCKRRFLFGTVGSDATQCHACSTVKKRQSKMQKKNRKQAENQVLQYTGGLNGRILPLRDMCLNTVSEHIEELEELGWIEPESRLKFAKIISRRRQLNNKTVALFLGPDEDQVQLFDCTYLNEAGLSQIPMQCPNLITLDLGLCGRMNDHVLGLIGNHCPMLMNLSLGGAFLPSSNAWTDLFPKLPQLRTVRLQFAAKFGTLLKYFKTNSHLSEMESIVNNNEILVSLNY
jgi:DNA repair protein RAD7